MHNSATGNPPPSSSKPKSGSAQPSDASFKRKRGVFQKDLQHMMYGFGDDANPLPETVALVEDIVLEYVTDSHNMAALNGRANSPILVAAWLASQYIVIYMFGFALVMVHKAQDIASKRGKLLTEDFLYLIRKDMPKLHRCTELLSMNEELKQARKAFEVDEEKLATTD